MSSIRTHGFWHAKCIYRLQSSVEAYVCLHHEVTAIGYATQGRHNGRKLSLLPIERQTDVKTLYRNAPSAKTL